MKKVTLVFQEDQEDALSTISELIPLLTKKGVKNLYYSVIEEKEKPIVSRQLRGMN